MFNYKGGGKDEKCDKQSEQIFANEICLIFFWFFGVISVMLMIRGRQLGMLWIGDADLPVIRVNLIINDSNWID